MLRPAHRERPGYVLLVVVMIVAVLSLTAYRFTDAMTAEFQVAYRSGEVAEAKALAVSGVHYTIGLLSDPNSMAALGNDPYDDQDTFANVSVDPNASRGGGYFSVVNVYETDANATGAAKFGIRYGVTDEAGKINLNTMMRIDSSGEALRAMLILLPNMTDDVADAITDWLDADDDQRASGAESGAYANYRPRNGPISSLEELLLVRGVTVQNLFGNDLNRNGQQDPNEVDGNDFNRGWSDYLTVYGHELNVDSTGQPRTYVNDTNLATINQNLAAAVGQELADYAVAYRLYTTGTAVTTAGNNQVIGTTAQLNTAVQASLNAATAPTAKRQIPNSMLALIGTSVTLPKANNGPMNNAPTVVVNCPLNDPTVLNSMIANVMDKVTAKSNYELNPRINVNTCPPTLLAVLPGVTADYAANAVAARANLDPTSPEYKTGAWLVTQAGMNINIFKNIETYITGYTQTYRVQSIGYFAKDGPVARVEAVVDTNAGYPRIVYYRDLTELGGGFAPPRD